MTAPTAAALGLPLNPGANNASSMNVSNLRLLNSIPQPILASAASIITKTAFLAGMVAPETAAWLSSQLMVSDAECSKLIDGLHTGPCTDSWKQQAIHIRGYHRAA